MVLCRHVYKSWYFFLLQSVTVCTYVLFSDHDNVDILKCTIRKLSCEEDP